MGTVHPSSEYPPSIPFPGETGVNAVAAFSTVRLRSAGWEAVPSSRVRTSSTGQVPGGRAASKATEPSPCFTGLSSRIRLSPSPAASVSRPASVAQKETVTRFPTLTVFRSAAAEIRQGIILPITKGTSADLPFMVSLRIRFPSETAYPCTVPFQ